MTGAIKAGVPGEVNTAVDFGIGSSQVAHPLAQAGGVCQSMVDLSGRGFDRLMKSK
jgi:hypothetical protein